MGGDINVLDDENETPLYTVETLDAARWLVEHGANAQHQNNDGQTVSIGFKPNCFPSARILGSASRLAAVH